MAESVQPPGRFERLWRRVRNLPVLWQLALALVAAVGVAAGGFYMYETYDYVQHDNEFCLSCHLMENPYDRFARSEHRELSCKACHQPTMVTRSRMAIEQIVAQPETLATHAEVPNERCAECHIEGEPDKWRLIQNTAGHRVHLESDDPELEGLQCVECHSVSLHQFVPTRRTCGQAGCHEQVEVRLGDMSDLAIHCVACHDFTRPTAASTEAAAEGAAGRAPGDEGAGLDPGASECLTCHEMRQRVGPFPADEPHGSECSTCHNPHEQTTTGEVVGSCTNSGCHERVDTLPNFHHQRESVQLENCAECHRAHEFRIEEENCLGCHENVLREVSHLPADAEAESTADRQPTVPREDVELVARLAAADPGLVGGIVSSAAGASAEGAGGVQDTVTFRHPDHEELECQACHSTGSPTATTNPRFCRSCHHGEDQAASCESCHRESELRGRTYQIATEMKMSVGEAGPERSLPFPHGAHLEVACAECHRGPPNLTPRDLSCETCHEEHHSATTDCQACHREAPEPAHPMSVHITCTGSGCHTDVSAAATDRSRNFCLTCHQTMTDHKPDRECLVCHVLPSVDSRGEEP